MKDGLLELKDAPMFGRVMKDEQICKETLERILGFEIEALEYLNVEQVMDPAIDARGVRLDVFAKGSGKVYDVEMQRANHPDLCRRLRYYQASMDMTLLDAGQHYGQLPESYIIFICENDPFFSGNASYVLERACAEDPELEIGDGTHWIVMNASAWEKEDDSARRTLLKCIYEGSFDDRANDPYVQRLQDAVRRANEDNAWRRNAMGFMTLEHSHRADLYYARKEGEAIEAARYNSLIKVLLAADRTEDLERAARDEAFRDRLFAELHID